MLKAIREPHVIDNRRVDVKSAVPKDQITSNKLFVGGLTQEVRIIKLQLIFELTFFGQEFIQNFIFSIMRNFDFKI